MGMMNFTLKDIKRQFGQKAYSLGLIYAQKKRVLQIHRSGNLIRSQVKESGNQTYQQNIFVKSTTEGLQFQGTCSCPLILNCHHVAAVLLTILQKNENRQKNKTAQAATPLSNWVQRLYTAIRPSSPDALDNKEQDSISPYKLLFVLSPDQSDKRLFLNICRARYKPTGEFSSISPLAEPDTLFSEKPDYFAKEDEEPLRLFMALRFGSGQSAPYMAEPKGKLGAQLLQTLIGQQRLFWTNALQDIAKGLVFPLRAAPPRQARLTWNETGTTIKLRWEFVSPAPKSRRASTSIDYILPTEPAWYMENLTCGELILPDNAEYFSISRIQELIVQAPPISAKDKKNVSRLLLEKGIENTIPVPEALEETVLENIEPHPVLYLGSKPVIHNEAETPVWFDYAQLKFEYDGQSVFLGSDLPIIRPKNEKAVERIIRDEFSEKTIRDMLLSFGFRTVTDTSSPLYPLQGVLDMDSPTEWLHFTQENLSVLEDSGWKIEKSADYRYNLRNIQKWYASVNENDENLDKDWFSLEIGIVVNKKHFPLFPLLYPLIKKYPESFEYKNLERRQDTDSLLATLPDKSRVALPWKMIRPVLRILGELHYLDQPRSSLPLHRLDSARLAELERDLPLQWINGDLLLEMGRKLLAFNGVKIIAPPVSLNATLRDYQIEGLSWMQFLREYGLAGILADDMGLGKTLQTLSHILLEKEAGRLKEPALIVAPTSLMSNWQDEAARFTPSLKVLLLQGKDRSRHFDRIKQSDIVLTTYALLPRDEEVLLNHEFHLLILDESQYIKNIRSKATQIASSLKARHKLCLTGTPLENHLGELWSQFHFLLPGLLGNEKTFNSEFRHSIEKTGDEARQELLNRRIKPFLLRRTKDKVARELPMKTEMVRYVELTSNQRQIYESVRELMDKKVQDEIAKYGIAHCQIIILEALLKLRQVCCDPRLLRGSAYKKSPNASSKLVELMEMLEELLLEKRHILVFSQFTSMLSLIEAELNVRRIPYALLTGDTADRASAIRNFQEGKVSVFLISLKAGGVGLNLTAADTVIHYDPWWNPAVENQATDRAWRIGQDKPVFVYKLIAKGTLEEKIQELQQRKADLASAMLSSGQAQHIQITPEDLQSIFRPLEEQDTIEE